MAFTIVRYTGPQLLIKMQKHLTAPFVLSMNQKKVNIRITVTFSLKAANKCSTRTCMYIIHATR